MRVRPRDVEVVAATTGSVASVAVNSTSTAAELGAEAIEPDATDRAVELLIE